MLDWEFYALNATTTLLWLCQTLDHGMLVGMIALGALSLVISLVFSAVRLVKILASLARSIIAFVLSIFTSPEDITSQSPSLRSLSYQLRSPQAPILASVDRFESARDAAFARLPSIDDRLSLPQSLALNPDQWSECDAPHGPTSIVPSMIASEVHPPAPADTRAPYDPRPSVRRSRRQLRARVTYST